MIFGLLFNKVIHIWKLKKKKKEMLLHTTEMNQLTKNAQIDICLPKTKNG